MKVLVSNDDGIFSPGIQALAAALREMADVIVVAPDVEQSASGSRDYDSPSAAL